MCAKGNKVESGRRVAHFMVAISYHNDIVMCEQYEKMNGLCFSDFVNEISDKCFMIVLIQIVG